MNTGVWILRLVPDPSRMPRLHVFSPLPPHSNSDIISVQVHFLHLIFLHLRCLCKKELWRECNLLLEMEGLSKSVLSQSVFSVRGQEDGYVGSFCHHVLRIDNPWKTYLSSLWKLRTLIAQCTIHLLWWMGVYYILTKHIHKFQVPFVQAQITRTQQIVAEDPGKTRPHTHLVGS